MRDWRDGVYSKESGYWAASRRKAAALIRDRFPFDANAMQIYRRYPHNLQVRTRRFLVTDENEACRADQIVNKRWSMSKVDVGTKVWDACVSGGNGSSSMDLRG